MLPVLRIGDKEIKPKLVSVNNERWVWIKLEEWQSIEAFVSDKRNRSLQKANKAFEKLMQREQETIELEEFVRRITVQEIKEAWDKKDWTVEKLAEKAGLSRIPPANLKGISDEDLVKIAKVLGLKTWLDRGKG